MRGVSTFEMVICLTSDSNVGGLCFFLMVFKSGMVAWFLANGYFS